MLHLRKPYSYLGFYCGPGYGTPFTELKCDHMIPIGRTHGPAGGARELLDRVDDPLLPEARSTAGRAGEAAHHLPGWGY